MAASRQPGKGSHEWRAEAAQYKVKTPSPFHRLADAVRRAATAADSD